MKIGVFDSGIGGEAVARDLRVAFPYATIITMSDRENLPYGSKQPEKIIELVTTAIQPLIIADCDVIVIACNTATTVALDMLKNHYPDQHFIGVEPMIKQAALLSHSHIACVCATPATLASTRYATLKDTYSSNVTIVEPNCRDWAAMIENSDINAAMIRSEISTALDDGADVIVLGCTHYHWIKQLIESIAQDRAIVIEPTNTIVETIKSTMN